MSKSERVDEYAQLIGVAARLAGSLAKNYAKKKALSMAKDKVRDKLTKKKKDPDVDQALDQEMDEALHTAYFNFAASLLETVSAEKKAERRAMLDKATGTTETERRADQVRKDELERKRERATASAAGRKVSQGVQNTLAVKNKLRKIGGKTPTTPQAGIGGTSTSPAAKDQSGAEGPTSDRRKQSRQSAEEIEKLKRGIYRGQYKRRILGYENDSKTGERVPKYERRRSALARAAIEREKDSVLDIPGAAARGFKAGRQKTKGAKRIDFSTEYQKIGSIIAEKSAAWTRKEGKNPSGGLNAKGVASYRAKNPGSKLKTAVTTKPSKLKKGSKAAKRRSSFCSRMSGMRKRQNPKNNTGKDRLSLSLKKWNC